MQPFDAVRAVLEATGAQRFLFVGPSVFLSGDGWSHAGRTLTEPSQGLEFLEIVADTWPSDEGDAVPSSLCFAWSAGAFRKWYGKAPRVLSGFFRDNGLPAQKPEPVKYKNAGRVTRRRHPGKLEAAVNKFMLKAAHA